MITNINASKYIACSLIDDETAKCRRKFITVIHGQESVYSAKLEEARAFIAKEAIEYPYLKTISEYLNIPIEVVADQIIRKHTEWSNIISPKLEALRIKYKNLVRSASSSAEIDSLLIQAQEELHSI